MSDAKRTPNVIQRMLVLHPEVWARMCRLWPESFDRFLLDPACAAEAEAGRPPVHVTDMTACRQAYFARYRMQISFDNGWHTMCEIPYEATAELAAQHLRQLADRVEAIGRGQGDVDLEDFS